LTRYGLGGQRNFSSLPRNHGGAAGHYGDPGDYYHTAARYDTTPKRGAALLPVTSMSGRSVIFYTGIKVHRVIIFYSDHCDCFCLCLC
jgi:hypothetical protein